ncbi:MAG: hypothetical protein ACRDQY_24475 [Pseudonocardiaceae bacterium]
MLGAEVDDVDAVAGVAVRVIGELHCTKQADTPQPGPGIVSGMLSVSRLLVVSSCSTCSSGCLAACRRT